MDKFKNKYRIPSIRLQNWDYGWNASYFITICCYRHQHFFGKIEKENMKLSVIGKLAHQFWVEIPDHFSFIHLDSFIVMPNHVHGILTFKKQEDNFNNTSSTTSKEGSIGQLRWQNQGKQTLSSAIGNYKSAVTRHARSLNPNFAWQTRFYEHIIRDRSSFERISDYIECNPSKWSEDHFYN